MKLFISLIFAATAGCLARGFILNLQEGGRRRSSGSILTVALQTFVRDRLLSHRIPLLDQYVAHLKPIMQEVPLPGHMDMALFLGVHLLTALMITATIAYAIPRHAWIILLPIMFCAGGSVPYFWLLQLRARLHNTLLKALPEWLDLTALVMEAGLDLSSGIQHYLQKGSPGPLQSLLAAVQQDTQMGRSRAEAFSALMQRTSFGPLRDICRGIIQALSLGSSLAPNLRDQATALRTKRMQIAEKKAAEAPLKILLPLFIFIVPTIFLVLFGPIAIMFLQGGIF